MRRICWVLVLVVLVPQVAWAQGKSKRQADWVTSWASAQMLADGANALSREPLQDVTLRQVVHLSVGGSRLRVRLSNAFGDGPLRVDSVQVAKAKTPGGSAIDAATEHGVTFGGQPGVEVPAGADVFSDAVAMDVAALGNLAISLHVNSAPASETSHPGARATSFVQPGLAVEEHDLPDARKVEHWYFVAAVDVMPVKSAAAVAVLGDSITDGRGSTTDGNDRWPDVLAGKLMTDAHGEPTAVLNLGIGGNRLLHDGLGPNALARFDRDVLSHAGVRMVVVLEGINDLGTLTRTEPAAPEEHAALVRQVMMAYAQMVERAHIHGISVMGATVMPDGGFEYYHPDATNEADRQTVNAWIRAPGHFDCVVDFDGLMRDPQAPDRLLAAYDSGDHIHPSPAGYAAMGNAVFERMRGGGCRT